MAELSTGDLSASDVVERDTTDERAAPSLRGQLEEASHSAHTAACHLRLLVAACVTQRGPSLQLCVHTFAAGMQGLSECVRELQDQLDDMPILYDRYFDAVIQRCSSVATQATGLMRLISDATGKPHVSEIEMDI